MKRGARTRLVPVSRFFFSFTSHSKRSSKNTLHIEGALQAVLSATLHDRRNSPRSICAQVVESAYFRTMALLPTGIFSMYSNEDPEAWRGSAGELARTPLPATSHLLIVRGSYIEAGLFGCLVLIQVQGGLGDFIVIGAQCGNFATNPTRSGTQRC